MSRSLFFIAFILFFHKVSAQDTLTLEQAIATGLEKNYSVMVARNGVEVSQNNNSIGNAGFLPSLNGTYNNSNGITNSRAQLSNGTVREGTGVRSNNTTANALLTWTVFDGFNMFVTKNRLVELERLGAIEARIAIENTVAQIIANYYAVIVQQKMLRVIAEAMSLSKQRRQLEEVRKSIGVGSDQPILQAMVDLNADSARLIQQLNAIQNSKADLNRLLARSVSLPFEVKQSMSINEHLQLTELTEKVNLNNSQVLAARSQVQISQHAISSFRSEYYPRINLFGGYNYSKNQTPIGATLLNQSNGLTYGITANINVFSGGLTRTSIQNSKILARSSVLLLDDTRQEQQNLLYKTFNNYTSNLQLIRLQLNNIEIARKDVDIAVGRFRLGSINDLDLRLIQQRFIDAEGALLNAQYTAKESEIELLRLSGQLLNAQ